MGVHNFKKVLPVEVWGNKMLRYHVSQFVKDYVQFIQTFVS